MSGLKNLDLLIPKPDPTPADSWRWGLVVGVRPLRVHLEGDPSPLTITPESLVACSTGDRVRCHVYNRRVTIMGATVAPHNKTLYTAGASGLYMQAGQTVNLSEKISEQENGVVLAWSQFENGAAVNGGWNFTHIPKAHTAFNNGKGVACQLALGWKALTATKYVYVSDATIGGNAINREAPQDNFVLRYVVGV